MVMMRVMWGSCQVVSWKVCAPGHAVHPPTTACGVRVSRLREELEAARAREVELNTELAAAQECFKMVR